MAKYLFQVSYTPEGLKGLLKEGGSSRREAAAKVMESLGGRLEGLYYAFGDTDSFVIADLPDNVDVSPFGTAADIVGLTRNALFQYGEQSLAMIDHIEPISDIFSISVDRQRFIFVDIDDHQWDQFFRKLEWTKIIGAVGDDGR